MASTRIENGEYSKARIALFPISVNPSFSISEALADGIREAVKRNRGYLKLNDVVVVDEKSLQVQGVGAVFPWTPTAVAAAARSLGFDAGIGVSVTSVSPESTTSPKHPASIDLFVTFADARRPDERKWILSGSWYAGTLQDIPEALQRDIALHFIDLKYYQIYLDKDLLAGGRIYNVDQPLLTIASPDWSLIDANPVIHTKSLRLVVTAMHEAGLAQVTVENTVDGKVVFRRPLISRSNSGTERKVAYISNALSVPLASTNNILTVEAIPLSGKASSRTIAVRSDVSPSVSALAVAASASANSSRVAWTESAATAVDALAAKQRLQRLLPGAAINIGRREFLGDLTQLIDSLAPDDAYLFYYAGPVELNERIDKAAAAYLLLSTAQTADPVFGSVSAGEIGSLLAQRSGVALMDLCTDSGKADIVRNVLRSALPDSALIRVQRCDEAADATLAAALSSSQIGLRYLATNARREEAMLAIAAKTPQSFRGGEGTD